MAYTTSREQNNFDVKGTAQSAGQGFSLLSCAQQRLWFLNQLEPSNPCYNIPIALTLTGKLNIAVLEQSINEILRRHEALRSIFPTLDGKPVQVIAPVLTLNVPVVELGELPEIERQTKADLLAIKEALKPFDLASGPLWRITLLRLSESKHVLLITMHQIVCDARSISVFFRELEALYEVFFTGTPDSLPELPIQYKDFVDWQQQWLGSEDYETQLAYWKQQLAGTLPVLELPTDRPRSPAQTFRGARQSLELPVTLTESLKALSQQEGVTLFMTLLAAFKVLLYRYTGEEDIIVGSPTPGRNCLESDALIGLFANTLVLRTDLSGNLSFRELLERVRLVALGAYAHQDLPFEKLVEELYPEQYLSRNPIFQVWFNLLNLEDERMELSGLTIETLSPPDVYSRFDLSLTAGEFNDRILLELAYNTDLFEGVTITRMLGHFQNLLADIVTDPGKFISILSLLSETEKEDLLGDFNDNLEDEV